MVYLLLSLICFRSIRKASRQAAGGLEGKLPPLRWQLLQHPGTTSRVKAGTEA